MGTKSSSESQRAMLVERVKGSCLRVSGGHARRALSNECNFILIEILEFIPGFIAVINITVLNIRLILFNVKVA